MWSRLVVCVCRELITRWVLGMLIMEGVQGVQWVSLLVGVTLCSRLVICVCRELTRWVLGVLTVEGVQGVQWVAVLITNHKKPPKWWAESIPRDIPGGVTSNQQFCVQTGTRELP